MSEEQLPKPIHPSQQTLSLEEWIALPIRTLKGERPVRCGNAAETDRLPSMQPMDLTAHQPQSGASMKGIGGHPAFQEVPSVVQFIEVKDNADGQRIRIWHCLKLRGSNYRRFSYALEGSELKVTDGHFFQNCREQLLIALDKQITTGGFTSPGDLIGITGSHAAVYLQRS